MSLSAESKAAAARARATRSAPRGTRPPVVTAASDSTLLIRLCEECSILYNEVWALKQQLSQRSAAGLTAEATQLLAVTPSQVHTASDPIAAKRAEISLHADLAQKLRHHLSLLPEDSGAVADKGQGSPSDRLLRKALNRGWVRDAATTALPPVQVENISPAKLPTRQQAGGAAAVGGTAVDWLKAQPTSSASNAQIVDWFRGQPAVSASNAQIIDWFGQLPAASAPASANQTSKHSSTSSQQSSGPQQAASLDQIELAGSIFDQFDAEKASHTEDTLSTHTQHTVTTH